MELTGQKWGNIKQGSSIFGKTLISLRRLPFGVNVMLNLSILNLSNGTRNTVQLRANKFAQQSSVFETLFFTNALVFQVD